MAEERKTKIENVPGSSKSASSKVCSLNFV